MQAIQNVDMNILIFIQEHFRTVLLDKIMPMITTLGNCGFIWIVIGGILLLNKKYRKVGIMLFAAIILTTILGEGIIKHIVKRPRPCISMPSVKMLVAIPNSYSFPSGHSGVAFASATILFIHIKKYGKYFFILAALIAFSRLYVFVHYPLDVLTGITLGVTSALIVNYYFKNKQYQEQV